MKKIYILFLVITSYTCTAQILLNGRLIHELPAKSSVDTGDLIIVANPTTGKPYKARKSQVVAGANGVTDGDKGDITVTGSGAIFTIDGSSVQNGKLALMGDNTFKGNLSGTTASPQDLTSGQVISALGINLKMAYTDTASLSNRINAKQNTLVSGSNIKSVNGNSLVGSGDLTITSAVAWGNITGSNIMLQTDLRDSFEHRIAAGTTGQYWRGDKTWQTLNKAAVGLSAVDNTPDVDKPISNATNAALAGKQAQLVSGTNIKTINFIDLLGSGNITIAGGSGGGETLDQTLLLGNNISATNQAGDTGVIRKRGVRWMHDYTPPRSGIGVLDSIVGVNTYLGYGAGSLNNTNTTGAEGGRNVAIGYLAGSSNTTGWQNVAIGHLANQKVTTGKYNTAIGTWTLIENVTGDNNTAVGADALWKNLANNNTAIGTYALQQNTTGYNNSAIGVNSQIYNISGYQNNSIGTNSLRENTTGANNVAIGTESARANTTGSSNLAIGTQSLYTNTDGANNIGIGSYALYFLNHGNNNTAIGYVAGGDITTGYNNTLIGYQSGQVLTTGFQNILLGSNAGDLITTGSNNIVIGYNINPSSTTGSNQLNIGDIIHGDMSSQSINIGTNAIEPSAILSANSTTKGFLLPRMTKTQRDAISSPATGLVIYQTDNTPGLRCYNGTNWMRYTETAD